MRIILIFTLDGKNWMFRQNAFYFIFLFVFPCMFVLGEILIFYLSLCVSSFILFINSF